MFFQKTWLTPPETQGGKFRGAAVGSSAGFSYAAQVVEVEVDEETGMVEVVGVWVAHDCGRAINPLAVEGQVQGSVWMGMGQALGEETGYLDGLHARANFLDYRIPTIVESPPIDTSIVEAPDPNGPFGAKEAGEGSLSGFLPAPPTVNSIKPAPTSSKHLWTALNSSFPRTSLTKLPNAASTNSSKATSVRAWLRMS